MARRSDHSPEELKTLILDTAKKIVAKDGKTALTARRLAQEIGYTPGTIYHVFGAMDGVLLALNAQTLANMSQALETYFIPRPNLSLTTQLENLAHAYLTFAQENRALWLMFFQYTLSDEYDVPNWYREDIAKLFEPLQSLLEPLFPSDDRAKCALAARTLWSSVHGLCFMEQTNKIHLIGEYNIHTMITYLIKNFIDGIKAQIR